MGERSITVVRRDEGAAFFAFGDTYRFLATGENTQGDYFLMEAVVPPGGGPIEHRQTREEEGFYVLEGEIVFHADGKTVRAGAGTFLNVPRDLNHWFHNETDRPARMLIFFAPAGIEGFFKAMSVPMASASAPLPEAPVEEMVRKAKEAAPEFGIEYQED